MKKKKIKLEKLELTSFVSSLQDHEQHTVKGGGWTDGAICSALTICNSGGCNPDTTPDPPQVINPEPITTPDPPQTPQIITPPPGTTPVPPGGN